MDKGIIYFASNKINNKVYVGQTIFSLNKRIKQHKIRNKNLPFGNSLCLRGEKNFNFGTIEYSIEKLNEMEIYWIKKLDTKIPNGYNCGEGGEGNRGYKHTKNQIKKRKKTFNDNPDIIKNAIIKYKNTIKENPEIMEGVIKKLKNIYAADKEMINRQVEKRRKTYKNDPSIMKRSIKKFKKTLKDKPEIMKNISVKRKKTYRDNPEIMKNQIKKFKETIKKRAVRLS